MDVDFVHANNALKNKPSKTAADELVDVEYKLTNIRTTFLK